jgi:hypothetical protein
MALDKDTDEEGSEDLHLTAWVQDRIARGHQLLRHLLDRGCYATDVVPQLPNDVSPWANQVQESVLGLAVSRADGPLIQRLVDLGADIYLKHQHFHHVHKGACVRCHDAPPGKFVPQF